MKTVCKSLGDIQDDGTTDDATETNLKLLRLYLAVSRFSSRGKVIYRDSLLRNRAFMAETRILASCMGVCFRNHLAWQHDENGGKN